MSRASAGLPDLLPATSPPKPLSALYQTLLADESGQDLIEYVLGAALISLLAISALKGLGTHISTAFTSISSNLSSTI